MSALLFTDRELKRAWRELSAAAQPPASGLRSNPHRLLLFYAVECGLKAVWLRQRGRTLFDEADIKDTGHNLQKILKTLRVGKDLMLSDSIHLPEVTHDLRNEQYTRNCGFGDLHQVWRYGGQCQNPTDQHCENQLQAIQKWIQGELK